MRRHVGIFIMLPILIIYSGKVLADSWHQFGSASMSTEYDSNPTLSPTYPGSVWRAIFDPSYTLVGREGASELRSRVAIHIERSSNVFLSENRNDPSAFLDWNRPTNTGEFGISAVYNEMATRLAETDISGPGYNPSTRVSRMISGKWSDSLSNRSSLSANVSYEGVFYMGGTYIDYVTRSGDMMFKYDLSELNATSLRISHSNYVPVTGNLPSDTTNYMIIWDWKTSDELNGNLEIGRYRISDAISTSVGRQFSANMQYVGQRAGFELNASQQVSPSGAGGYIVIDQATANWKYALSEFSNAGIDLIWQKNHYQTNIINRNPGIWLQNELNSFWNLRTYFQHRTSEETGVSSASSNIFGISFTYSYADS